MYVCVNAVTKQLPSTDSKIHNVERFGIAYLPKPAAYCRNRCKSSNSSCLWGGSVAEWLACWTQAQKGQGSNRSRDTVG